jgi:hypothetical protein
MHANNNHIRRMLFILYKVRQSTSPRKSDCCSILQSQKVMNHTSMESYQESALQEHGTK